jgi:hypothetical protein
MQGTLQERRGHTRPCSRSQPPGQSFEPDGHDPNLNDEAKIQLPPLLKHVTPEHITSDNRIPIGHRTQPVKDHTGMMVSL